MKDENLDAGRLERRQSAVESVHQVMHAIWLMAQAQLSRAEAAVQEATTYLDWIEGVVDGIAGEPREPERRDTLWVLMGPERAYCGALSWQIVQQIPADGVLGIVGARLREVLAWGSAATDRVVFSLRGPATADEIGVVARELAAAVLEHVADRDVRLIHPVNRSSERFLTVGLLEDRVLVPVPPETFSTLELVLDKAMYELVTGRLGVGLAEALVAEVRARVVAADAARQSCDELLEELERDRRVLRQESITSELLDIAGGMLAKP